MALLIESESIPLEIDANGVIRAGGTRRLMQLWLRLVNAQLLKRLHISIPPSI